MSLSSRADTVSKVVVRCWLIALSMAASASWSHPGAGSAVEYFSHALEHRPQSQTLYIQRGIAFSNTGQLDLALADLQQAQDLGQAVYVDFALGVVHYRRGDFAMARACFDRYLSAFPNHEAALEYRARVARDQGDYQASIADFRRVLARQAQPNPGHYIATANMLVEHDEQGIHQALTLLDEGTAKIGLTPALEQRAIELELARGHPEQAIERLESLRPVLGKSPSWTVLMAELKLAVGDSNSANEFFTLALRQLDALRPTPAREALRERIATAVTIPVPH